MWLVLIQKELFLKSSFCCLGAHFPCMKKLHAKSPCCRARVVKFGARRRQCAFCKKTWRLRKKKRGRSRLRGNSPLLLRFPNHVIGSSKARAENTEKSPYVSTGNGPCAGPFLSHRFAADASGRRVRSFSLQMPRPSASSGAGIRYFACSSTKLLS